jgi:glycerol-3-phosphate dehydrogenase (NAD(P)+)
VIKQVLNKLVPFMVRQAHHERNQIPIVRPEPVEGLDRSFLKLARSGYTISVCAASKTFSIIGLYRCRSGLKIVA